LMIINATTNQKLVAATEGTAVTLPVLEFSIAFLLALVISKAVLVALIGQVSLGIKFMLVGLFSLKRLSK
jgi:hypothetical protein